MICDTCGNDYAEQFENSSYCFGCGKRDSIVSVAPKKIRKPLILNKRGLGPDDYQKLYQCWGISMDSADNACLEIAIDSLGNQWLYMPVFEKGVVVHAQLRAWSETCRTKYQTLAAPKPGLVWASFWSDEPKDWVVLVEGILDGIRVGEVYPTLALLGTHLNSAKLETIQKYGRRFLIMLDAEAKKESLTMQRQCGILKSRIYQLPSGDPTDYSLSFLRREIINAIL